MRTTEGITTTPFIQTAGGTSLFVTEWGSGPPVVFTHAWGLRSDQWDYQVPALAAAGMRRVLYDRRGHGRSDRPAAGYDLDIMADDLAAVIDHFGRRARPVRQRPRRAERRDPRLHPSPSPARPATTRPKPGMTSLPAASPGTTTRAPHIHERTVT
jgi:alpha-beta hydrolase superfamily lysophospholipase